MKKIRIVLLILCVCLLMPFLASCKEKKKDNDVWDIEYDDSSREMAADSIPFGYSLDGQQIGIFYAQHVEDTTIGNAEEADIVYTRIYERNATVERRLNCDLNFISSNTTIWNDVVDVLKQGILANDGSYEIVFTTNNTVTQEKLFNYFQDVNYSEYIDLNERWWYKDAIEETSVDGYSMRLLYGDISISTLGNAGAIYYNKDLYEQYLATEVRDPDYLYQVVLDGKWTLEYFANLVRRSRIELGPDGEEGDIFGFSLSRHGEPLHYFPVGCDVRYYTRNDRGLPVIDFDTEKAVSVVDDLRELVWSNPGSDTRLFGNIGAEVGHELDFQNGLYIFRLGSLIDALSPDLRDMQSDYGILPYPKYDETQEEYMSFMANGTVLVGIPISVNEDRANSEVSAVIEALASESYRNVSVAFYETALKSAYTRDDTASQMIDIITGNHETVKSTLTKNFLYEYSSSMSGIGTIIQWLLSRGNTSVGFASRYASIIDSAKAGLEELLDYYLSGQV